MTACSILVAASPPALGVGVTAVFDADARAIFAAAFGDVATITGLRVIADMAEVDPRHVLPNIGNVFARGIRFPLGAA